VSQRICLSVYVLHKKITKNREIIRRRVLKKTAPTCSYVYMCWYQNAQIPIAINGHASKLIGISTHTGICLVSIIRTVLDYRVPICANYQV
jgi:hypothetical protein